ncbi:MAG: efflux RND transporter permease subunit, partial [Bradyrhizobium sp.]|nr:efflux RND transporter permease subunit [Bradyrhizobium sp.]
MIARIISWSARNLLLVLFGTGFAAAAGLYALVHLPLDAIPDLSDTQVIVYTEYPGQAPQVIEDQVTYPLTTAMLTVPRSKVVRGFSFFGVSFVYVIFEDGTDIYWARSRVMEFLNSASSRLPAGVTPTIGPDATGVGWVYQYAVMSKELNLAETRTIQDWNLKFALAKAGGVAEVASIGGFVKQYNVILDPQRMRDRGISMQKIRDAIRASNADVGGRTVELSEFEYVIRGKGYLKSINDLGNIVLKTSGGTPVLLRDVASVELGPDERRGIAELNGEGEVASGIVLQRFGVNALDVIENVKARFKEIASSLPSSVEIVPVYDRSNLIYAAIDTLKHTLLEESLVVAVVCVVFLLHIRSALVAILMLPVGVLMAFGAMKLLGLGSNIMSLGGIAIAIGAMVDAAIVMIENMYRNLEHGLPPMRAALEGARQIGFTVLSISLSLIAAFVPLIFMDGVVGRLLREFSLTLTFAIVVSTLVSLTVTPMICAHYIKETLSDRASCFDRIVEGSLSGMVRFYAWTLRGVLVYPFLTLIVFFATIALTVTLYIKVPKGYFPTDDSGFIIGATRASADISFQSMLSLQQRLADIVMADPAVAGIGSTIGGGGGPGGATSNRGTMFINLKPPAERDGVSTELVINRLRRSLAMVPGIRLFMFAAQDVRAGGRQSDSDYQYTLSSPDLDLLQKWAPIVAKRLETVEGITDISSDRDP